MRVPPAIVTILVSFLQADTAFAKEHDPQDANPGHQEESKGFRSFIRNNRRLQRRLMPLFLDRMQKPEQDLENDQDTPEPSLFDEESSTWMPESGGGSSSSSSSGKGSGKKGCSGKKSKSAKKGSESSGKKGSGKKGCTADDDDDDDDEDTLEPASPTMAPGPTTPTTPTTPTAPTGGGTPPTAPTPTVAPTPTPVQNAASMFSGVITGDLLDYTLTADDKDSVSCANPPDVVDDVYICAAAAVGDGPGGILGAGGPESARFVGFSVLPVTGYIEMDSEDIDTLVADGRMGDFVKQQFGYVYGLGFLWEFNQLLGNDACTYNLETQASAEFQTISGCSTTPVPTDAETCISWSEDCLQTELFTSTINVGVSNPLSRITIGSLQDLGYTVSFANADPFTSADLNPTCVCSAAALRNTWQERMQNGGIFSWRRERQPKAPKLSAQGRAKAEAYGQKRLREKAAKRFFMRMKRTSSQTESSSIYLGDRVVYVFYEENETVHTVKVQAE